MSLVLRTWMIVGGCGRVVFRPSDLPPEIGRSVHLYLTCILTVVYMLFDSALTWSLCFMLYNLSRLHGMWLNNVHLSMWEP